MDSVLENQNSKLKTQNSPQWEFICPACRALLEQFGVDELRCPAHGGYSRVDGVWRMLAPGRDAYFAPFLRDYTAIRDAEGYGYAESERYHRLPAVDPADPLAWQWRMRARSFAELERRVLEPMVATTDHRPQTTDHQSHSANTRQSSVVGRRSSPLRVLDLGAGVGWLSHRLAQLGHAPCAIDLNLDPRDGLGAARHYPARWPLIQAEFDRLPLADEQADLVVFNASLHYSANYHTTLAEARRVLRPDGRIVVMDSPIYRRDASGQQMITERQRAFEREHGTRSDALPSIGYLTWQRLHTLGRELGLRWRVYRPWYGWRWALRPWRARLLRRREPSTFALLVTSRQ